MRSPLRAVAALVAVALVHTAAASGLHPEPSQSDPERQLMRALYLFRNGDVQAAIDDVQQLVAREPNFRLAQLVYGDLLASRSGAPVSFDAHSGLPRESVEGLVAEARQRWRRQRFDPTGKVPAPLLLLAPSQPHVLLVDTASSRLFVFENRDGVPELIADYYVSAGKNGVRKEREGDRRTPLGVYFVTGRLPDAALPDKYGPVAFPVDYPNAWDRRHARTGTGIWLHGVASGTFSRPPLDSDGCVAMSNADLLSIAPLLEPGRTPIVIADGVEWLTAEEAASQRARVQASLESWRTDWQAGRGDRYLSYYAEDFQGRGMNKAQWIAYKERVTSNKEYIEIGISDLSIYAYPDEENLYEVTFDQEYRSDRFTSNARKLQYWRLSDGASQIVAEEATMAEQAQGLAQSR
jgi:murein L,D-transpeptidase YafK